MKIVDESQKTGSKAVLDLFAMQCQANRQEAVAGKKRLKQEMAESIAAAGEDQKAVREAKRKGEDAIEAHINGLDPFYKLYCMAYEVSSRFSANKNVNWADPGKDVGDILDSLDEPVEEKLKLLYVMRENARENLYSSGLDVKGKSNLVRMEKMGNYQERYAVGKKIVTKEQSGEVSKIELDDDVFAHNFGNMSNCFMLMFSDKYKNESNQAKIKREESKDIADFCDKKIREYHLAILNGELKVGQQHEKTTEDALPDPYFTGASFQTIQNRFTEQKGISETFIMSAQGRDSLKSAKLFARGSNQFDEMQTSYKELQEAIRRHEAAPSAQTLKTLTERARLLNERTDSYLDYKQKQIDSGEIKGTKTPDGQGGFVYRAENSNTQKRMDFAQNLKKGLAELDGIIRQSQPKVEQSQRLPG